MAERTRDERALNAGNLASAARDRGMEQLESAKGQLAAGAERVADAVEQTAEQLEGNGDDAVSGFGHSMAGLMRQLAGGLRERDIDQFAHDLGTVARRNPGMFLAGSVALGFGVARFFKAQAPQAQDDDSFGSSQDRGERNHSERTEYDADESLDLSGNPPAVDRHDSDRPASTSTGTGNGTATDGADSDGTQGEKS